MRWPLLRRGSRVRGRARQKLNALLASKLATARAWDLKETFSHFWKYKSVIWAGAFLDYWCFRAMRSRLEPMKKVARMLRAHEALILNWFRAKGEISNGAVEGLNNKIRVVTRRSYGFRTYRRYGNCPLSQLGTTSGTRINPQILLRRPIPKHGLKASGSRSWPTRSTSRCRPSSAGTQEYMAMEKLGQVRRSDEWDLIVVDTPPSRSALDFLDAPERLGRFLDGRLIRVLASPVKAGRPFTKVLNVGFSMMTGALTRLLGAQVLRDAQTFITAFDTMFGGFRERAEATYRLLQAPGNVVPWSSRPRTWTRCARRRTSWSASTRSACR